ncbi:RNA polymerase sigma factor [Streptosporangium carneum]|uniref:DNA-directed RNA polymerase sigma-70 factor n=1 Tax=Streptosporangium carneum TaxID=47481 RepID=A0A9W6I802_9ACTN|nr:RNA polymerase sigma factor [Streptosporangium carneum]GLK13771.1 DNA-directed RNA polymerase sigma-70 factor [Streptosporangium carneum]
MNDEASFTRMFQEHYESVLRYAWRRVGSADAPDIAAETFKIAWEKYDGFPRDQPLPWLYVTARNLTLNLIRKDRRRERLADWPGEDLSRHAVEQDHAYAVTARQAALAALDGLSDDDRELVLLVSWEGLDLRQAAVVVGCSRPVASMRLHRARKRLRRLLADEPQSVGRHPSYGENAV